MHYFSYTNSKWFRQTDKHINITQNIRIFRSLVPVQNNLPFFNDMLQFWYQSWVPLFVLFGFFVSIKTISLCKIDLIKFFCLSNNDHAKWILSYINIPIFRFSTSFEQTARSSQSAIIWWHPSILVTVMSISILTLRIFVSIKTSSSDIKLN